MNELYNLQELANKALIDLNSIGIYPSVTPNDFTINKRARKRFGLAQRHRNSDGTYDYSINISAFLLDKRNDVNSVMNTVYHECLHCCDECWKDGHKGKWLEYAEKVNRAFKVNISRCSYFSERLNEEVLKEKKEREEKAAKERNAYIFHWRCEDCGSTNFRIRKKAPKWYMHIDRCRCSVCNGHNLIVWKDREI
jgi:uncharacterized protein YjaZ